MDFSENIKLTLRTACEGDGVLLAFPLAIPLSPSAVVFSEEGVAGGKIGETPISAGAASSLEGVEVTITICHGPENMRHFASKSKISMSPAAMLR